MKKRQTTESIGFGAFPQVMVVGVLLFAVIWQLNGTLQQDPGDGGVPAPVIAEQSPARSFMTTDDVNLRRGPGTDHEVISVVPMHAEVLVTGEGLNGFLPVSVEGTSAWLASDYVVPEGTVLGGTSGNLPDAETPAPADEDPSIDEAVVSVSAEGSPPINAGSASVDDQPVTTGAGVPVEEPVTLAAQVSVEPVEETAVEEPGERWVEVDRSTATVTLHEGDRIVDQFQALIGKDPSPDGYYSTAVGTFYVHTMTRELAETPFAPGVYLSHFVGFDAARSNGFHSPTRDAAGNVVQTGGTTTLGCVRLGEAEAIQMFEFAYIGMRVEVHD